MNNHPLVKAVLAALTIVVLLIILPANAAENRYSMAETKDGTIRLDRKSGAVSYCRKVGSGIVCTLAADERQAWVKVSESMEKRIVELEKRIARLEAFRENDTGLNDSPSQLKKDPKLPVLPKLSQKEEGEINRAMRVGELFLRRFVGVLKELKSELDFN